MGHIVLKLILLPLLLVVLLLQWALTFAIQSLLGSLTWPPG